MKGVLLLNGAMPVRDGVVNGIERVGCGVDEAVDRRRLTGVLIDDARAQLARDLTTPGEPAVALLHSLHSRRVVATPTTHDVTAVRPPRRLPALPARCAQRS